jgi:hypothetical protein
MVVGGVAFQTRRYAAIAKAIRGIKNAANIQSEMKWSKFRGGERTKADKAVVDLFYSLLDLKEVHFHCIVAEFGRFNHGAFEGGDSETSVNRMYYQLLVHRVCRFYARRCYIFVYPDQGNDSRDIERFHGQINLAANKRYRVPHRLARIEQTDSSRCEVMQMVDVIVGGIAHRRNFPPSSEARTYKADLADYILQRSQHTSWVHDTPKNARRFTVWNFRHQNLVAGDKAPQSARRYIRQG